MPVAKYERSDNGVIAQDVRASKMDNLIESELSAKGKLCAGPGCASCEKLLLQKSRSQKLKAREKLHEGRSKCASWNEREILKHTKKRPPMRTIGRCHTLRPLRLQMM